MSSTKQTSMKKTEKIEKVEKTKKIEEPVEEPIDGTPEEDQDVVEEAVEEVDGAEVVEGDDGKKTKKVEFNCETIEEAYTEMNKVDLEIEQKLRYRKAVCKTYQKLVAKQQKQTKKRRSHSSDGQKEATGFIKAKPVPEKFKEFYEKNLKNMDKFSDLFPNFNASVNQPRTDITKMVYHYIRTNELYKKKDDGTLDRRSVKPDKILCELFNISEGENIGFNNFQTYVSRLYEVPDEDEDEDEHKEEPEEGIVSKAKEKKN